MAGKMGKYNKNPKMVFQRGENCQVAMDFVKLEGVQVTNIGMARSKAHVAPFDTNAIPSGSAARCRTLSQAIRILPRVT
jgi:hypothetical protein